MTKSHPLVKRVLASLPPARKITIRGEPDYYGASWNIAEALDREKPPRSFASWLHGWIPYPIEHPNLLVFGADLSGRILMPNEEHASYLRERGFERAEAVGSPIVYVDDPLPSERIDGSLLIMPPHTLPYMKPAWENREYIKLVLELRSHFSMITACVSANCMKHNLWKDSFSSVGIPVITGASLDDANALLRMSRLFRSFEFMTTNAIGSHLAYAALFGCRCSVFGPVSFASYKDHSKNPFYRTFPKLLPLVIKYMNEDYYRSNIGWFFREPQKGVSSVDWAAEELGVAARRAPEEVARLLGWGLADQIKGYLSSPRQILIKHLRRIRSRLQKPAWMQDPAGET